MSMPTYLVQEISVYVLGGKLHIYIHSWHFSLNKTPDEGHPASSHTLCKKLVAYLSLPVPSFPPNKFLIVCVCISGEALVSTFKQVVTRC